MKGKGLKKDPACSWIEIGNSFHAFIAHDRSHPESDEINRNLDRITEKLVREGGYVARTKHVLPNVGEKDKVKLLHGHSERLAISYGLLKTACGTPKECRLPYFHQANFEAHFERDIIVWDANRFHHFSKGVCSCGDFW